MKPLHRFLPLAVIPLALASISCNRLMVWVSTKPASWSYVNDAWGGIAAENPTIESGQMALPVRFDVHAVTRVDSAICIRRVNGRVDEGRVIVGVDRCLCQSGPSSKTAEELARELVAHFSKPAPGRYTVVYDDASAGFPKIGDIEIR